MTQLSKNLLLRLGIRQQLVLTFSLAIMCFALASSLLLSSMSTRTLSKQFRDQGVQITSAFAKQSTLALLYQSVDTARDAATITIGFPDVSGVAIYKLSGDSLYHEGVSIDKNTNNQPAPGNGVGVNHIESEDYWQFTGAVYVGNAEDEDESPFATEVPSKELVGTVAVVISKHSLSELSNNILRTNLFIAACLAAVSLLILLAIINRVIRPIKNLSDHMRRAQEGEENVRAALTGPNDIVTMGTAFNTMMGELESRQNQLKVARDSALAAAHAKGEFAACVSHELRTPMNGVMGMLELMQDMGLNGKKEEYIKIAQSSGHSLLNLIDDILDFSKLESAKMKLHPADFSVRSLVGDIVELLDNQAQSKNLQLKASIPSDLPPQTHGDGGRIRQILINLVGNALKFTHTGGVFISINEEEKTSEFVRLKFSVRDTGIGIPKESQASIFEAFTQADSSSTRQYGGTGLGLAICSQLVRLMGGELGLESELEKGSTFWFTIPLAISAQAKEVDSTDFDGDVCGLRVLNVNADPEENRDLVQLLEGWECFVRSTNNSLEALSMLHIANDQGKPYDLVLADMNLPDMSGELLAKEILAQVGDNRTGVIMLLNAEVETSERFSHEQVAHIMRPLDSAALNQVIGRLLKSGHKTLSAEANPPIAGTRIESNLPALPELASPSYEVLVKRDSSTTREPLILVVEDNRANQHVAMAMLERLELKACIVNHGVEALERLNEKTFHLILMDCHMPIMDGYATTRNIRKEKSAYNNIPIIAMTANVDDSARQRCLESGMSDYLSKPLQLESLRLKLKFWLEDFESPASQLEPAIQEALISKVANAQSVETEAQVINLKTINKLQASTGRAFPRLMEVFLEDVPQHINELKEAVSARNPEQIFQLSHRIKGAAASLGGDQLTEACKQLEKNAESGDLHNIESNLIQFQQYYGKFAAALLKQGKQTQIDWKEDDKQFKNQTILVVDDDRATRLALSVALAADGLTIVESSSGIDAVNACEKSMPDLVLMDAMMPGISGFEATKLISQIPCHHLPPILMITSLTDEASIEQAFEVGATDYVSKPVNLSVLRRRVARLLQTVEAERNIYRLAYSDQLTGLPNRAQFAKHAQEIIASAAENGSKFALLFIDLDNFKRVNDTLGHDVGDQLLKIVSTRIQECMRTTDLLVRLGGDEFTVVLEDIQSLNIVSRVAEKICSRLAKPFEFKQQQMRMPTSIGIALYPQDGDSIHSLMKHADTAMFKAKASGGDHFQFYEYGMEMEVTRRVELERELRNAVKNNELVLHYQPQINTKTGALVGNEALVRWQHPERGFLPPAEFITIAEESGLIIPLGEWVLRESCHQLKEWLDAGIAIDFMAINVSNYQLQDKQFLPQLKQILKETKIPPQKLKLEMTESVMADGSGETVTLLKALKQLGLGLAIDDFGTGYSSLSYLKHFPFDTLKLDRSFIKDYPEDGNGAAIISGIIALGHRLNMEIIAEGIETEEQRRLLTEENCDVMQGYLFSRPLPEAECREWMMKLSSKV